MPISRAQSEIRLPLAAYPSTWRIFA